ncbi:MAG: hypothetical protein JSU59_00885 [Nitrospirota bacterium]|nr:MAG: hypothetical protein JSU59_00885 [Nitrospirota bacterium]
MSVTDWSDVFTEAFNKSGVLISEFVPRILIALLVLLLGFILARLVASGITRLLQLIGFDRLVSRTAFQVLMERSGTKKPISAILGTIGFWLILSLFLLVASESLRLPLISEALTSLFHYLPRVGIAILILVLGLIAANFVRELIIMACSSAGITQGTIVAQAFYVAAILLVVVTSINQLGINTALLDNTIILIIAGLIGGSALSFGLGARSAVANLIAAHYLRGVLRVGVNIRMGNIHGKIVALTPVSIVVETDEGRVVIPAAQFNETTAIISNPEG